VHFVSLTLADLHPVLTITLRHLATTPPPPSVPHAGNFASLAGKVVSEFPASTKRCVLAPRSCLLYAGGVWEPSAHTALLVAAILIPFWFGRPQPVSPVDRNGASDTGFSRQHRAQGLSPFPWTGSEIGVVVSGLPTLARAIRQRRPLSPRVTVHTRLLKSNTSSREQAHNATDLHWLWQHDQP